MGLENSPQLFLVVRIPWKYGLGSSKKLFLHLIEDFI